MARASGVMLLHYLGYFGSMILVWLVMVSSFLKGQPLVEVALPALLLIASILFGVVGLLHVVGGGGHGGKR
ncbi:MAG: hypothetical protein QXI22_02120 [Sulfolobales archaeon]